MIVSSNKCLQPRIVEINKSENVPSCKRMFLVTGIDQAHEVMNLRLLPQLLSEHPEDANLVMFDVRLYPTESPKTWDVELSYKLKSDC